MFDTSIEQLTDADLARRVSANVERGSAEAELCRRFAARIRAYGRRHLQGEDAAAELMQRVLVLTLEKLRSGQLREPERIGSFVLGVARMTAHGLRRGQRREAALDADAPWEAPAGTAASDMIARPRLTRCLEALEERERNVVIATYFTEQDSALIAAAIGVSLDNVRQIRRRALLALRRCMGAGQEGVG